jgi:hypothetical protein
LFFHRRVHAGARVQIAGRSATEPQVVVTNRSGAKAYFFRSLRINFTVAWFLALGLDQHVEVLALGVDGAPDPQSTNLLTP